jgi:hypothetical protein
VDLHDSVARGETTPDTRPDADVLSDTVLSCSFPHTVQKKTYLSINQLIDRSIAAITDSHVELLDHDQVNC